MLKISSNNINLFNDKIIEYLNFLEKIINDEYAKKKIIQNINKIQLGIKLEPSIIITMFYNNIYSYNEEINNKNENVLEVFQFHLFKNKIDLKKLWINIKENDRETIWKYLKIFILLCEQ